MTSMPRWTMAVTVSMVILFAVAGILYFQSATRRYLVDTEQTLRIIAEHKQQVIEGWRKERLADATVLFEDPSFKRLLARFLRGDSLARADLQTRFASLSRNYNYLNVVLVNRNGESLLSLRAIPAGDPGGWRQNTINTIETGMPGFAALHNLESDNPHLEIIVPFPGVTTDAGQEVAVILQSGARNFLYNTLARWPVPSETGEILMVRRDGDDVLFLSWLRFHDQDQSALRIPVTRSDLPAARAVAGEVGFFSGRDYRDHEVYAWMQPVPDSRWFLVAKLDRQEVQAALLRELRLGVSLLVAMLLMVVAVSLILSQRRATRHLQEKLALETARAASEWRFQQIIEQAPVAMALTGRGGTTLYLNPRFTQLFGYTDEDVPSLREWWSLAYPDPAERAAVRAAWERKLERARAGSGVISSSELVMNCKDKRDRTVEISGVVLDDDVLTVFSDRTRERRAELALRRSEEVFRAVFETSPVGMVFIDPEGTLTRVNQAFAGMLGQDLNDLLQQREESLTHPDDREKSVAAMQRALTGEVDDIRFEKRYRHAKGHPVWTSLSAHLLREADGSPSHFIGIIVDISELKQTLEAMTQSEERFRLLAESVREVFWMTSADGRVLFYVNPAYEDVWGRDTYSLYSDALSWLEAVHEDDRARVRQAFLTRAADGDFDEQYRIVRGEGELRWIHDRRFPVRDSNGQVVRVTGLAEDITERRSYLDQLHALNESLAQSNEELQQFAYVASHDLQEPLRMVSSYTRLLAERYQDQLDDKANLYIHYAVDGANRMQELIRDLLKLSRVGTRGKPAEPVNTRALLETLLTDLSSAINETGAVIEVGDLPDVVADPTQLRQVFQNLISNAIKFHGEEPPRIHVSASDEGDRWQFAVADNGIGIPPDQQSRIFQVFQRLHVRDQYPGSGIGLAIVRKIVERHGGRIDVDSAPGEGATFRFTLPKPDDKGPDS